VGLFLAGILVGVCLAPPDPEVVRGALDRVLAERTYQTRLPGESSGRTSAEGRDEVVREGIDRRGRRRTGRTADRGEARDDPSVEASPPDVPAGVGNALFYAILVVLGVLLVAWLASEWRGRRRGAPPPVVRGNAPSAAPPMEPVVLDEIDALARAGRYGEAVHLLLLRTIAALPKTTGAVPRSLTSREILRHVAFRPGAAEAMEGLVDAVEVSLFGGRPVSEPEYVECRARFERVVRAQGDGAA
jgi:hypothetical protein